jgi:hypothetical protein
MRMLIITAFAVGAKAFPVVAVTRVNEDLKGFTTENSNIKGPEPFLKDSRALTSYVHVHTARTHVSCSFSSRAQHGDSTEQKKHF